MRHLALLAALALPAVAIAGTNDVASQNVFSKVNSDLNGATNELLSDEERVLSKQWMLEESDWLKYKQIMSGPRGIWSPGLDPITALGVSETNPVERKRYADIWMKMETKRAELEIAFEVERQSAAKRLHGDKLAIDNTEWIAEWNRKQVEVRKVVNLFVDPACTESCVEFFDNLQESVGNNARLDIYFTNGATSEDLGRWAAFMKIPPEVVKSRKITLNYDNGKSSKMGVDSTKLPQVRVLDVKSGKVVQTFES